MSISGVQAWAAPVATIVAAIVAGAFARVASRGRSNRLKLAVDIREHVDSSQRADWDNMIARDVEAVMRQATRPPVLAYVVAWLGVVTFLIGQARGGSTLLFSLGLAVEVIGVVWLAGWWIREWLGLRAIKRRLERERDALQVRAEKSRAQITALRQEAEKGAEYSKTLLLATGAPARTVERVHVKLLDDLDAGRTPESPRALVGRAKRTTWRLRRWYRKRKFGWNSQSDA